MPGPTRSRPIAAVRQAGISPEQYEPFKVPSFIIFACTKWVSFLPFILSFCWNYSPHSIPRAAYVLAHITHARRKKEEEKEEKKGRRLPRVIFTIPTFPHLWFFVIYFISFARAYKHSYVQTHMGIPLGKKRDGLRKLVMEGKKRSWSRIPSPLGSGRERQTPPLGRFFFVSSSTRLKKTKTKMTKSGTGENRGR